MVRNNRRKAFTIVELVIVIAVIAILAAVMIPTFTGIIKRANISADQQLAASINTQLSIYKAEGNKIETEADLIKALTSDEDFTAHLNPKSAKHGYHYWYDATKQAVELLTYDEVRAELETHNDKRINQIVIMDEFAAGGDGEVKVKAAFNPDDFAKAAPRTIVPGFYFLDQTGENENEIANFFNTIASMGEATADYITAIADLKKVDGDNEDLAQAILAKMEATAIMTNKGAYINVNKESNIKVNNIYVPAKGGEGDYYLNHTIINVGDADVDNLLDVTNAANSIIELPEGVKVAEGGLVGFAAVTIKVPTKDPAKLSEIFAAESVAADATIVLSDGRIYQINGTSLTNKTTGETEATLAYKDPATSITIGTVDGSGILHRVVKENDQNKDEYYIALERVGENGFAPAFTATPKTASNQVAYSNTVDIVPKTTGVKVENGKLSFENTFDADTITLEATVASTVTTEEGVKAVTITKEITVKVIRLYTVQIGFSSNAAEGSGFVTLATNESGVIEPTFSTQTSFFLAINGESPTNISTEVSFAKAENFGYIHKKQLITLNENDFATLGVDLSKITVAMKANNAEEKNYFIFGDAYTSKLQFVSQQVTYLAGGLGEQSVEVTVGYNGKNYSTEFVVDLNDNTNSPFNNAIPTYKNDYVYTVGNDKDTALPFEELFEMKEDITGNLSEHELFVFAEGSRFGGGDFWNPITSYTMKDLEDAEWKINFGATNIYQANTVYWLVIGTKINAVLKADGTVEINGTVGEGESAIEIVSAKNNVTNMIKVKVVAAKNLTDKDLFTNIQENQTNVKQFAAYNYANFVLHDNITIGENTDGKHDLELNSNTLYGNYFTITAKKYIDEQQDGQYGLVNPLNKDGYSFIRMIGTSHLKQVIIDGPVYSTYPTGGSKDTNGLFCYGVNCYGNSTITDSYIFGFLTPVRLESGCNFNMVNSVIEGGTWANMWIANASKITLDNSMTIQDFDGYTSDIGPNGESVTDVTVIGLGIYADDSMAGKSVEIIFKGNTKQINWFGANASFGGYADKAKELVFKTNDDGSYVFSQFIHTCTATKHKNVSFVNAGISWQANATSSSKEWPTIKFTSTDWTIEGNESSITYAEHRHTMTEDSWFGSYTSGVVLVQSSTHDTTNGPCDSCEMLNADIMADYGVAWFRGERVN